VLVNGERPPEAGWRGASPAERGQQALARA
jgi:hypothetical protein